MIQEQINEYSIVMAEFMGYKREFETKGRFDTGRGYYSHTLDFLCFSSSYDNLMPVWIKFNDLGFDENVYLNDTYQWFISRVGKSILNDPIKTAFEEMYKAIEWYNKELRKG